MARYEYRSTRPFWYVGFGLFFAIAGLICLCVSFTTDHWVHYDVDRDELKNIDGTAYGYTQTQYDKMYIEDSKFFTRNRGMFRTCYEGNSTWVFKEADPDDVDDCCLREISYEFEDVDHSSPNRIIDYEEDNYELRKHLMRCHLAFFILGIILLAIAIIVTTIGCWCEWFRAFLVACVVCFLAALFLLLAMVFFHWYKYLEEHELDFDPYDRKAWHQEPFLDRYTNVTLEYSYALGWVAFACTFLAFIFFALAAWSTRRKKLQEDRVLIREQPQQQVYQPAPAPAPQPQPTGNQDGNVYIINHYPNSSTERLVQQPQYVPKPAPAPQPAYPTQPVYTGHTVYQSALPPGTTNVFS